MTGPGSPFWNAVGDILSKLPAQIAQQSKQPSDGVFLVSVPQLMTPGWVAGRVVAMPKKLAAQRIVEGGHALASDVQIEAHLAEMAQRKRDIQAFEQSRKGDSQRLSFTPPVNRG